MASNEVRDNERVRLAGRRSAHGVLGNIAGYRRRVFASASFDIFEIIAPVELVDRRCALHKGDTEEVLQSGGQPQTMGSDRG